MNQKIITVNRKARSNYDIIEALEAGMVLQGTEVKALRERQMSLKDSYAKVENGEVFLVNAHISPYSHGNVQNHDPVRQRKLLLHKREIKRLMGKTMEKGLTLIPLKVYFSGPHVKIELGLARGKKVHDKRETIKKRDVEREIRRELKEKQHR